MKQYISDVIPYEEIKKWQNGNRILITSQTGSGKSEFIKNNLYQYAKESNKKILLLSNRNLLKNQNIFDIGDKVDLITAKNYQELEVRILEGKDLDKLFAPYDYVVYDEVHYMFSDSLFNRNTDLLLVPIKNTPKDKVFIFITATPEALIDFQPEYNFQYTTDYDYSYIKNIVFYNHSAIAESILQNIPYEEKAICFLSNAQEALDLSNKFLDSAFICSVSNSLYPKASTKTMQEIVEKSSFDVRLLFSTKVLDNGVNIKDDKVKHIIIDMLDPISFIQCLGRKRILKDDDYINLYIKNYHGGNIYYNVNDIHAKIKLVNELKETSEQEFKEKYRKKDFDNVIDNDYQINYAKYQNFLTSARLLGDMLLDKEKIGYKKFVCKKLNFNIDFIKDGDKQYEAVSMDKFLTKYVGKKLFKEEQEEFKRLFFDKMFSPKKTNYRRRGIRSINAILEEDSLPYILYSKKEKKRGGNRDETYWIIVPL